MPAPVVLLTYYNAFGTGGMETHIQRLASGLSRLGHYGELITPADPAVGPSVPDQIGTFAVRVVGPAVPKWIPWWDLPRRPDLPARYWARDFRLVLETLAALDRIGGHVLYVPGPVNLPLTATLNVFPFWEGLRALRGLRVVLGARGAGSHWYGRPAVAKLFNFEERAQLRLADVVTVVDHYYAEVLFPARFRDKYVVITNGVDPAAFQPGDRPAERIVSFVGRLTSDRGIEVFLDAVDLLRNAGCRFRAVGDGPLQDWLRRQLEERHLPVEWLGGVPHSEMPRLYQEAYVVVNPSPVEGIGNITLEAMACGRCVIRTASGYREFAIRDGENGMTFPRGDAQALAGCIRRALGDPDLVDRLGRAARETILRSFTVETETRAYSELFDRLAGAR